jgi:hypothetical protein
MVGRRAGWKRLLALWIKVMLYCGLVLSPAMRWQVPAAKASPSGTTVVFEALAYDGYLQNSSSTWSDAWAGVTGTVYSDTTSMTVGDWIFFGSHYLRRSYLFFNTSSIPDTAVIESWYISCNFTSVTGTGFNITVLSPISSTYPHIPLQPEDFNKNNYQTSITSNCTILVDTIVTGQYNNFTASTEDWIDETGITKFCLRTDFDINNQEPTASKYASIVTNEGGSPAKLYVTFTYANAPQWSNLSHNSTAYDQYVEFSVLWTDAILQTAIFSWNLSGIWQNFTLTVQGTSFSEWTNTTKKITEKYVYVSYKFYAQADNGKWNVTQTNTFYSFPAPPETLDKTAGITALCGRNGIVYHGNKSAVYIAFLNSTDGNYYVLAYDMAGKVWTEPIYIATAPTNDAHWIPSIGYFPNGCISVWYGYYETVVYYRMTTQSADVEGNLTVLLSSWTEERNITVSFDSAYAQPICFDDSFVLFYRDGGSAGGVWKAKRFNGTSWESEVTLITEPDTTPSYHSYYLQFNKQDNKILITGFRHFGEPPVPKEDVMFIYSDDKGVSWKFANGTTFSPPITTGQATVLDTPSGRRYITRSACLDKNGRVIILGVYRQAWGKTPYAFIVYSNTEIGNSSINFNWHNATTEDGDLILSKGMKIFYDFYYEQPSFWGNRFQDYAGYPDLLPEKAGDTVKYVCTGRKPYEFRQVINQTDFGSWGNQIVYGGSGTYEIVGLEHHYFMGKRMKGSYTWQGEEGYVILSRFYNSYEAVLTGIRFRLNITEENSGQNQGYAVRIAVYDDNLNLLTADTWDVEHHIAPTVGASDAWSGIASFQNPVKLNASTYYYLGIMFKTNITYIYYDTGGTSLWKYVGFVNNFPSTFTNYINYSRTCSMVGVFSQLKIRGTTGSPRVITYGTNTTLPGKPCKFYSLWTDVYGLSHAQFYWNYTGVMTLNGTFQFTDNPIQAWANFTRTLPAQTGVTISYYIIANNTGGIWGNTTTQYLTLAQFITKVFQEDIGASDDSSSRGIVLVTETIVGFDSITKFISKLHVEAVTLAVTVSKHASILLQSSLHFLSSNFKIPSILHLETVGLQSHAGKSAALTIKEAIILPDIPFKGIVKHFQEALAFTDQSYTSIFLLFQERVTEQLTIGDRPLKVVTVVNREALFPADFISKQIGKTFVSAVTFLDSATTQITITLQEQIIPEHLWLQDSVTKLIVLFKTENLNLQETITKHIQILKEEALSLLDTLTKQIGPFIYERLQTEKVGLKDRVLVVAYTPWYNNPATFIQVCLYAFCIGLFAYYIYKQL